MGNVPAISWWQRVRRLLARLRPETDIGRLGERAAARYLRRRGLTIIDRNARRGRGEIDLVALEGGTLVFVEVKSRSLPTAVDWTGLENLDARKRLALRKACLRYRKGRRIDDEATRVDVIAVGLRGRRVESLRWYRNVIDLDAF